jgi:hypothetical protein
MVQASLGEYKALFKNVTKTKHGWGMAQVKAYLLS